MKAILFTLLGLCLFVGAVVLGLVLFVGSLGPAGGSSGTIRETLRSGDRSQTIVIIPISGIILDDTEKLFRQNLETAADDANVRAIVIDISSPGGTVSNSNQMYHALLEFKARKKVPVFVHMDDIAASGGYYVACAADEIFAEETTLTGSIGVLIQYPQLSGFAEKTGIKLETIVADTSPQKNFLDTFEPADAEGLAIVKRLLNDQHELFRGVVSDGRGSRIAAAGSSLDEVTNGAVFLGPQAMEMGLVDQIGFLDDTINAVATKAGLTDPTVIRYGRPPTLAEQLGLATAPQITLDGESARAIAIELWHEATAPQSLYLYNGAR